MGQNRGKQMSERVGMYTRLREQINALNDRISVNDDQRINADVGLLQKIEALEDRLNNLTQYFLNLEDKTDKRFHNINIKINRLEIRPLKKFWMWICRKGEK